MDLSLILCTADRGEALGETLKAMAEIAVPADLDCEMILVDNGAARAVAEVARRFPPPRMSVRSLREPRRGLGHARNTGIAAARGDVLLFTDDDVRPPRDWIERMCAPIRSGRADAVAGGVRIAPELERPWMGPVHRAYLAATDGLRPEAPETLIGANMAFARAVLSRVPEFDAELGAGRLGMAEESLFAHQLLQAGYRIASAFDACVEHHFDASRLLRGNFLEGAKKMGRSWAYVAYHWEHWTSAFRARRLARALIRLALWRSAHPRAVGTREGCAAREIQLVHDVFFLRQLRIEEQRPRNYEKHGLVKRANADPAGGTAGL